METRGSGSALNPPDDLSQMLFDPNIEEAFVTLQRKLFL